MYVQLHIYIHTFNRHQVYKDYMLSVGNREGRHMHVHVHAICTHMCMQILCMCADIDNNMCTVDIPHPQ